MPSRTLSPKKMTVGQLGLLAGSGKMKPFSSVWILYCCCTSEESRAATYQSGGVLKISVDLGNSLSRIALGISHPCPRNPRNRIHGASAAQANARVESSYAIARAPAHPPCRRNRASSLPLLRASFYRVADHRWREIG